MTFSEWLSTERGRVALVATRFGITPSAVTQWRVNGVPAQRILDLMVLTAGQVSAEEMLLGRSQSGAEEREGRAA